MVAVRRDRIKQVEEYASDLEIEVQQFPDFEDMTVELGRAIDIIPYASASEVTHSAVSAATDGYVSSGKEGDKPVRLVGLLSEKPSDRLGYARAAINSTAIALFHGFSILDLSEPASYITKSAAPRVETLKVRQQEISSRQSEGCDSR